MHVHEIRRFPQNKLLLWPVVPNQIIHIAPDEEQKGKLCGFLYKTYRHNMEGDGILWVVVIISAEPTEWQYLNADC